MAVLTDLVSESVRQLDLLVATIKRQSDFKESNTLLYETQLNDASKKLDDLVSEFTVELRGVLDRLTMVFMHA